MAAMTIRPAASPEDLAEVRALLREYHANPDVAECVTQFEEELRGLESKYPWIFLAESEQGEPLGCVAIRLLEPDTAEIKRLYVRPSARGLGAGRALMLKAMEHMQTRAVLRVRLDSLPSMDSAQRLYRSLGFKNIEQYYPDAPACALFFEREL